MFCYYNTCREYDNTKTSLPLYTTRKKRHWPAKKEIEVKARIREFL
jgi:hypothetical protein